MADEKIEKLPIDAKLLTDAVIELNISRRSVGLYPREHPIVKESIERAFAFLTKLFEIRSSITLAITKDFLMIDDYILDKKNPVFREFAFSQYKKGIIAITFSSGLEIDELIGFHELLVTGDEVVGQAVLKVAEEKKLKHIKLVPIDLSRLKFSEGGEKQDGSEIDFWGNYIKALLEGTLVDSDAEGIVLNIPPEEMASFLNERSDETRPDNDTYDRVITTYLKKKEHTGVNSELFSRFIAMVEGLSPEIKKQLLQRAFNNPAIDTGDLDHLITGLSANDMEKLMGLFSENSSLIPESLRNIIDKLGRSASVTSVFDALSGNHAFIDDIEIDENVIRLFRDDKFRSFVTEDYKDDLAKMLKGPGKKPFGPAENFEQDCSKNVIDKKYSDLVVEMLETDITTKEDYLALLTKISEIAGEFVNTGRFLEVSDVYNTVYTHTLTGRFREEASSMLDYFFHSKPFIDAFIESLKIWGRHNREGVLRLVNVQRRHLIDPLFEALENSEDPSVRKFLLQILGSLGRDIIGGAVARLRDERWYVVRNMIYLIREAGGAKNLRHIRQFTKNGNKKICLEAVRTLIHFKTPDALSYMKLYIHGDDPEMRDQMVKLAGIYRYQAILPYLIELIEKRKMLSTDLEFKQLIVKVLGDIRDPRAIKSFEKIVMIKPLLYRSAYEALKVEIYRSIQNYPPGSATSLLEMGMGSKNEEIRKISEGLLRGNAD
jgi:hypothetical protein